MSPCRARAEKPNWRSEPATSSTSLRVLQNTTADSGRWRSSRPATAFCRNCGSTSKKRCSMSGADSPPSTETSTGSRSSWRASSRIASGKVAENSRVWRWPWQRLAISRTGSSKPMSSMRSASSSTRVRTTPRCSTRLRASSCTRPGVPTTTCGSCACSEAICGSSATPPVSTLSLRLGMPVARRRSWRPTWSASSRVGHSTSAWQRDWPGSSRCSKPRPKAAVLPLPVGACASRSRPSRIGGSDCAWIGVAAV
ncbi:hypothetical protein L613_000900000390 [Pseudoxanthomonas taiwanensis J19]|uniref:Uncharacterized protein n=1 Tax=Pseudoxanthomonas taiwanensis J19 TaxID=935569 RepID=A0A562CZM2_9GAMM|nr:hypothetical protein L613_000900000390 [Pseudoxanthomonas taiwanensis J19]